MFEDDDDFEIDEEFLDGVFDAEKSAITSDVSLKISRNNQDDNLDFTLEPSPEKKRKSSPISSQNRPDSTSQTIQGNARLIALVSQRHPPSQISEISEFHSNKEESNINSRNQEKALPHGKVSNQIRAPGHDFLKPAPPPNLSSSPVGSPALRNLPRKACSSESSFTVNTSRVRQRKFPGPAGLLPERGRSHMQGQRPNFSSLLDTSGSDLDEPEEPLCSQSSASVLEDGPWSALKRDLTGEGQTLLRRYTVAWVKQKAAARQLVGQKVPFLAAVLHNIDCSSPDPCVVLRDPTGEIPGTLHRSVWDSFGGQLIAGSALVLRLVGVLSAGISTRRHYLNITSNNIVTIYSSPLCESSAPDTSNKIRKTDVHKWTLCQLLQAADTWEDQSKQNKAVRANQLAGTRNVQPFPSSLLNNADGNFRPPLQTSNRSNSSATGIATERPTNRDPATNNRPPLGGVVHVNSVVRPLVPSVNRGSTVASSNQGASIIHNPPRQENSVPKPVNQSTAQNRFVPKRPSFASGQGIHGVLPSPSTTCGQKDNQTSATSQSSRDLFSDADDIDISSVLDGIDSESLFGDF